jgi:hypothetical protein
MVVEARRQDIDDVEKAGWDLRITADHFGPSFLQDSHRFRCRHRRQRLGRTAD